MQHSIHGGEKTNKQQSGLLTLLYEMLAVSGGMMWFLPWQDEQGVAGRIYDNWSCWQF